MEIRSPIQFRLMWLVTQVNGVHIVGFDITVPETPTLVAAMGTDGTDTCHMDVINPPAHKVSGAL